MSNCECERCAEVFGACGCEESVVARRIIDALLAEMPEGRETPAQKRALAYLEQVRS